MARPTLTTEQFIIKAKEVHGDKYDYSMTDYKRSTDKIILICPIHGIFEQRASTHLNKAGCRACSRNNKKLGIKTFIHRAKLVHNNKYDYSKTVYTHIENKIIITCPIHGDFMQTPGSHLAGHGCGGCAGNIKRTTEEFINKAMQIHGNKYNYCKVNYTNKNAKVIITCPEHGEFEQIASEHINGANCPKCQGFYRTVEEFVNKAHKIHNYKYIYNKAIYVNAKTKVTITCPEHGDFKQSPNKHLAGQNCPICMNNGGFDKTKPAYLYYLKVTTEDNQVLYKIGITNRTVNERFSLTDLSKIEIVKQKLYENGSEALAWETKLKQMYKEYQYKGPDILSSGNTELFTEDIIAMYYKGCVHTEEN